MVPCCLNGVTRCDLVTELESSFPLCTGVTGITNITNIKKPKDRPHAVPSCKKTEDYIKKENYLHNDI